MARRRFAVLKRQLRRKRSNASISRLDKQVLLVEAMKSKHVFIFALLLLLVSSCRIPSGKKGECRTSDDCTNNETCWSPGRQLCGMQYEAHECQGDKDCPDNQRCARLTGACETGTVCAAKCTSDSCPDGTTCNVADGDCVALDCRAYGCPATTQECLDSGSCNTMSCEKDKDCHSSDLCVNGRCSEKFGYCSHAIP